VPEQSGTKSGTAVTLSVGELGPHLTNTILHGPMPTSVPSGILIHPTVWPQYTNVTYRQTGQTGQRSRSIGRTVGRNSRPKEPCVRALYMDKSNGDGVETEKSFTFSVIGVAVSRPDEATSGLAKLLPAER